jgi:hypothetical protein
VPRATPSNTGLTSRQYGRPSADAHRWSVRSAFIAAFSAAWFGACGSAESGPPVPIDDFPRLLADAVCNNIGPCCQQAGFPHDQAECHATLENGARGEIEKIRMQPAIGYDPAAARDCVDAYGPVMQACTGQRQIEAACRRVFFGTLQPGQTCTGSGECIPGATCHLSNGGKQCVDSKELRGKLGQMCSVTCTEFENGSGSCSGSGGAGGQGGGSPPVSCYTNDGLYCDSSNACATVPGIGQACMTGIQCGAQAFCDNGTCVAKRTSGSCGQRSDGCADTAYCEWSTQQCYARRPTGAPCATSVQCTIGDGCTGGACRAPTIASAESCRGGF